MRFWIGLATTVLGVAVWFTSRHERADLPAWMPTLAVGVIALGIGALASSQPGIAWSIASSVFSLAAIILFIRVIWRNLKRR